MKYLITLKPLTHETNTSSYSVMAELNWETRRVERALKIPAANFSGQNSFMRSFSQGVCKDGNKIFLAGWNFIMEIDYSSFQISNVFSHNLMSDIHSISVTKNDLFVCSTGIDTLLCFDRKSYSLKWFWRIEDSGIDTKLRIPIIFSFLRKRSSIISKIVRRLGFFQFQKLFKISFKTDEYRSVDKRRSPYHAYHMNEFAVINNQVYICTKGWNDNEFTKSAIIVLDLNTRNSFFLAKPGTFCGAHDLLFLHKEKKLFVTESGNQSIGILDINKKSIEHRRLCEKKYFIRGIASCSNGFLVGFTSDRLRTCGGSYPFIIEYDNSFNQVGNSFVFDQFYTEDIGGAIHNIFYITD